MTTDTEQRWPEGFAPETHVDLRLSGKTVFLSRSLLEDVTLPFLISMLKDMAEEDVGDGE
jgi:hypothetical protein